jgi:hypothetical protein
MLTLLSRREALFGAVAFAAAGSSSLASANTGTTSPPRAVLAFDDDELAAQARHLVESKGFNIHTVDLRSAKLGPTDVGAGVLIVACRDLSDGRRFARSTATAFGCKLLVYGANGWSYYITGAGHESTERETDEIRAGMVLDLAAREHANRPRPMIRM